MNHKTQVIEISFASLLGLVFITLKLCGVINWPWVLVTLPIWLGPAAFLSFLLITTSLWLLCTLGLHILEWREKHANK